MGIIFVMANQMLIVFGVFADRVKIDSSNGNKKLMEADTAFSVFGFFLFFIYSVFGMMLGVFRNDIIRDVDAEYLNNDETKGEYGDEDDSIDLPPEDI